MGHHKQGGAASSRGPRAVIPRETARLLYYIWGGGKKRRFSSYFGRAFRAPRRLWEFHGVGVF